jgi:hypothetical protein
MSTIIFDTPLHYPNKKGKWSHLVAGDLDTLHAFAKKLGKPRSAFQNKKKKNKREPHYDIQENLVSLALSFGAKQVTRAELLTFLKTNYPIS